MKKKLLGLGTISSVVIPTAAVVSCGQAEKQNTSSQQTTESAITGVALTQVKEVLNAALAIPTESIAQAVEGENLSVGNLQIDRYTRATFNQNTSMQLNSDQEVTKIKAGDELIMGAKNVRRINKQMLKVWHVSKTSTGRRINKDIKRNIDYKRMRTLQQDMQIDGQSYGTIFMDINAKKDSLDLTKVNVKVEISTFGDALPKELIKNDLKVIMNKLNAIAGIENVTTINYTMVIPTLGRKKEPSKTFVIKVPKGKANNLDVLVKAANASV